MIKADLKLSNIPRFLRATAMASLAVLLFGCVSQIMKRESSDKLLSQDEYDRAVKVAAMPSASASGKYVRITPDEALQLELDRKARKSKQSQASHKKNRGIEVVQPIDPRLVLGDALGNAGPASVATAAHKEPDIEDSEGFSGRRPVVDPFRVGEKVTFEASYFGVAAGNVDLEVRAPALVNNRKAYQFVGSVKTISVFAVFYAVDDWFETFVDFEKNMPWSYALHVKESKQLRETRCLFDWKTLHANFWDKRITQDDGIQEKKLDWAIQDYSQNIFSAPYYLRNFKLDVGKKIAFRVAHEGDNILLTAEVLRKEKLSTAMGELDTVVVRPHVEIRGIFKPIGEILIWFTDDDRKFVVRIESKIKIGTIVAQATAIDKGLAAP